MTIHYCKDKESMGLGFAIYQFLVLFAVPALLMIFFYSRVISELWKSTRTMKQMTGARYVFTRSHSAVFTVGTIEEARMLQLFHFVVICIAVYEPAVSQLFRFTYIQGVRAKFDTFCFHYISELLQDIDIG